MSLFVKKYGGTSVATPERIQAVAESVTATRGRGHDIVVVVSAMGKTTDELTDLATEISERPAPRELDLLLASGEQVSSSLVAMAVQALGQDAIALTGAQSGIVTSDSHGGAQVVDVRTRRIRQELARGRIVIVAGFQGMTPDCELTTLGRGGSDTSAVALAGALGAESCEICTDVDGVFSADPRVVPNARRLESLDYDEMRALSLHGARVLHVEAVEMARHSGVRIQVRSSFDSDGGSWIGPADEMQATAPRVLAAGIAGRKDLVLIAGESEVVRGRVFEHALEASVAEHDIVVNDPSESPGDFELLLKSQNLPDADGFAAEISRSFPETTVTTGLGSVSAVGRGLAQHTEVGETIRRSLPAPVLGHFACPVSMSCILPARHVDDSARSLHETLVEPAFRPFQEAAASPTSEIA